MRLGRRPPAKPKAPGRHGHPARLGPHGPLAAVLEKFPHLAGSRAFKIPANRLGEVPEALKSQLAIEAKAGDGTLVDATVAADPGRARRPLYL